MLIISFHFPSDSLIYNIEFRVIGNLELSTLIYNIEFRVTGNLEPSTAALTK